MPDSPGNQRRAPGLSLKARAISLLSRREHSRAELERKLSRQGDAPEDIARVLDELARENWQSDTRFAQNLVHRRSAKQGSRLIVQQLRQHGVSDADIAQAAEHLQSTELERARDVWERKFGEAPADAKEYARQFRFLAARGFSADCLRRILGELPDQAD